MLFRGTCHAFIVRFLGIFFKSAPGMEIVSRAAKNRTSLHVLYLHWGIKKDGFIVLLHLRNAFEKRIDLHLESSKIHEICFEAMRKKIISNGSPHFN